MQVFCCIQFHQYVDFIKYNFLMEPFHLFLSDRIECATIWYDQCGLFLLVMGQTSTQIDKQPLAG